MKTIRMISKHKQLLRRFYALMVPLILYLFISAPRALAVESNIYFVGGSSPSDTNSGRSVSEPFATLSKAATEINKSGSGSYEIIVMGDTVENSSIVIGDGVSQIHVTISNMSYVTIRRGNHSQEMIQVNSGSTVNLRGYFGSSSSNLIFDGNSQGGIVDGPIILNRGKVNIYTGVCLKNNSSRVYGSAITNLEMGSIYMNGGSISFNYGQDYGAIYNSGSFQLYDGEISQNTSNVYGAGVFNQGVFEMVGGTIKYNHCQGIGAGIYNTGVARIHKGEITGNEANGAAGAIYTTNTLFLSGGIISDNYSPVASIYVDGDFKMTGGNIIRNRSLAVYINKDKSFTMDGGVIRDNSAGGISVLGNLTLSGDISISSNSTLENNIILASPLSKIKINGTLSGSELIYVNVLNYSVGRLVLYSEAYGVNELNYRIRLADIRYEVSKDGLIKRSDASDTYYVGGANASDSNNGSRDWSPFATLEKAISEIGNGIGTIVIQSDLSLSRLIDVYGEITIKSDGKADHIIRKNGLFGPISNGDRYVGSFFQVYGTLNLGDATNSEASKSLIFDASFKTPISGHDEIIYVRKGAKLNLFHGIIIQNNTMGSGVYNEGSFQMLGGKIRNNSGGRYSGGVANMQNAVFTMSAGEITSNQGYYCGGVFNDKGSTFRMSGGVVSGNQSDMYAKGIFQNAGASFNLEKNAQIMNGDDIWLINGAVITIDSSLTMQESEIPLALYKTRMELGQFEEYYSANSQVLKEGNNYRFSINDVERFRLVNQSFALDQKGMLRDNSYVEHYDLKGVKERLSLALYETDAKGCLEARVELSSSNILKQAKNSKAPLKITIPLQSELLKNQFSEAKVKKLSISVIITDELQDSEDIESINIILGKALLEAARKQTKDITVVVLNGLGEEQYTWIFSGDVLANTSSSLRDLNLSIEIESVKDSSIEGIESLKLYQDKGNKKAEGIVIRFAEEMLLPIQSRVRIHLGKQLDTKPGSKVYLYHYNYSTGKLDSLPYSSKYTLDKEGFVTIDIVQGAEYILLPKEADSKSISSLLNQIAVKALKTTLPLGKGTNSTTEIRIELPPTLELVKQIEDKTSGSVIGAAEVSFHSSDARVASVDDQGIVKARKAGKATITTTITLYSGKTATWDTVIIVK